MEIIVFWFRFTWSLYLTHFGLVTPYGNRSSGSTLAQLITWTNVDWSSVKSSDIHIRTISQEMPQPPITKIYFKVTYLKFHSNFPGANELRLKTSFVSLWLDNEKATSHCLNKNMTQLTNKNMHVQAPIMLVCCPLKIWAPANQVSRLSLQRQSN